MEINANPYELPENALKSFEINDLRYMTDEGISSNNASTLKLLRVLDDIDYRNITKTQITKIARSLRKLGLNIKTTGKKEDLLNQIDKGLFTKEAEKIDSRSTILNFKGTYGKLITQGQRKGEIKAKSVSEIMFRNLDKKQFELWASLGVLGDNLGDKMIIGNYREQNEKGEPMGYSSTEGRLQNVGKSMIKSCEWIDSIYSDSSQAKTWKKPRNVKRGIVSSVNRNICNKNTKFIKGIDAKPSCINPKTKDASFAPLGHDRCPTCKGLASKPTWRFGGSRVNAKFAPCIVVRPNGTVMMEPSKNRCAISGLRYPKIINIHTQKIGGRHSMKIDKKTSFYSGSFSKVLYPLNPDVDGVNDWVGVWVFHMNTKQERKPNYNPLVHDIEIENVVIEINHNINGRNHVGAV